MCKAGTPFKHQSTRLREKNAMIASIDKEKTFDKI